MPDNTPNEPIEPITSDTTIQPVPEVPATMASDLTPQPVPDQPMPIEPSPNVLADYQHPVGSAYDPMPLQGEIDDSRNWLGVVSLIFGIIGGSIIAIVFGIIGLSAVKKGKATNRSMNVWGIVLGAIWFVISIVATIAFVVWVVNEADGAAPTMANAEVGDCYESTAANLDSVDGDGIVFGSCEESNAEVFFVGTYEGAARPVGDSSMEELAEVCVTQTALSHLDMDVVATYRLELFAPNAGSWDTAPHTVVCAVANDSGTIDPHAVSE